MLELKRTTAAVKAGAVLVLAILGMVPLTVSAQDRGRPLWEVVAADGVPERAPEVVSSRVVRINVTALTSSANARFSLSMPDGETVLVVRRREERQPGSVLVWYGQIDADPHSSVTLAVSKAVVVGTVRSSRGALYRLRYWRDDLHVIERLDPRRFPRESEPRSASRNVLQAIELDTCASDSGKEIDVMVLYTDDARMAAGGVDAMIATVYLAVGETNQSYIDSKVRQRLRLVHVAEVDYTETADPVADRAALQSTTDGVLDGVHALRDQHAADIVALLTETGRCGASYIMTTVSNTFEDHAFAAVSRHCAMSNLTFGHELGHIMSARHDRFADPIEDSPYSYNHAHLQPQPTGAEEPWRTIMAVDEGCQAVEVSCNRIAYWSNPRVKVGGDDTGVKLREDNHRTLNNTALTVANFRCSSRDRSDVWMKDTWSDTGAEPDPGQSSEAMWKSPYIWVRNAPDPQRVHQHEHQNPRHGRTQFIYVKLHNGGNAESGTLEVYGAPSATGLSWPNDWSLLASKPVSIAGHASTIAEVPWMATVRGNYCLLARWVSAADPMTTPEGPAVSANVRANNNLIWRNVNIVDVVLRASAMASFIVRNVYDKPAEFTLVVRPGAPDSASFIGNGGEITLSLPRELVKHWSDGRRTDSGFRRSRGGVRVTGAQGAVLEGLRLPPRFEASVSIRFTRPRTGFPLEAYELDVVQSERKPEGAPGVVGGVSYDIRTNWLGN
jgi:hypothetical protein